MLNRDKYDRFWSTYRTQGPVDWRSAYHRDPDPSSICSARTLSGRASSSTWSSQAIGSVRGKRRTGG